MSVSIVLKEFKNHFAWIIFNIFLNIKLELKSFNFNYNYEVKKSLLVLKSMEIFYWLIWMTRIIRIIKKKYSLLEIVRNQPTKIKYQNELFLVIIF